MSPALIESPDFCTGPNLDVRPKSSRFIIRNSTYSKGFVSQADVADDLVGERVAVLAVRCTANSLTNPYRRRPPQVLLQCHDQLGRVAISLDPFLHSQSSQHLTLAP